MKDFILMLQFFTRIPLHMNVDTDEHSFARGVLFFPIVGLLIGAFCLGCYELACGLFPGGGTLLAAIFAVFGNVIITGGLHMDGLADTCDGIYSGRKRERILEIMKDSHIGTFGTIGILFDILLRVGLLQGLGGKTAILGILLAPVIAKTAVVQLMAISTYARSEGMGGFFLGKMVPWRIVGSFIIGMGIVNVFYIIVSGPVMLGKMALINMAMIGIIGLVLLGYRHYIYKYINGMTGDTVGAANEVFEWLILLMMVSAFGGLV